MLSFSHLLVVYITFLVFGALLFHGLSSYEEKKRHIQINQQIHGFLYRNRKCLTGEFEQEIIYRITYFSLDDELNYYVDYFLDK